MNAWLIGQSLDLAEAAKFKFESGGIQKNILRQF
jgi:hypothetical protein